MADPISITGKEGKIGSSVPENHNERLNGYAEVDLSAPAVHLVTGLHFYYADHLGQHTAIR